MTDVMIQILSVLVAATSAIVSVIFSLRASRESKRQSQMQVMTLFRDYYSDLQDWADCVIEVITEAIFLCDMNPQKMEAGALFAKWLNAKQRVSTLIEQGRFFLPNEDVGTHGQHKYTAYRGFRPPELDCLVDVYNILRKFDYTSQGSNQNLRQPLLNARKRFVSQLQQTLNPRDRETELRHLARELQS